MSVLYIDSFDKVRFKDFEVRAKLGSNERKKILRTRFLSKLSSSGSAFI
jgi:hypothetical protein